MKQNLCRADLRAGLLEQLRIQAILEGSTMETIDEAIYEYLKGLGVAGEVELTEKGKRVYDVRVLIGAEDFNFQVRLRD